MNSVTLTGIVCGNSELRRIESGRELLGFEIWVDGYKGKDPVVHVGYFPGENGIRELRDGARIIVRGALRHRRDAHGLFVAAKEIELETAETRRGESVLDTHGSARAERTEDL